MAPRRSTVWAAPVDAPTAAEVANAVAPKWHVDTAARVTEVHNVTVYFGYCRIHPQSILGREEAVARAIRRKTGGYLEDGIDVMVDLPTLPDRDDGAPLFELATAPLGRAPPKSTKKRKRRGAEHRDGFSLMLKRVGGGPALMVDIHEGAPRRFFQWVRDGRAVSATAGITYPFAERAGRVRLEGWKGGPVQVVAYDAAPIGTARVVRPAPHKPLEVDADAWKHAGVSIADYLLDKKNILLVFEVDSNAQALGIYAEIEVDECYVDMRPLAVFAPGTTGQHEVLVPYDDEGGDELTVVLYLFALNPVDTVDVPWK